MNRVLGLREKDVSEYYIWQQQNTLITNILEMNREESEEFKSADSPIVSSPTELGTRLSLPSEKHLLQIYSNNIQRKKQLLELINKLEPKIKQKKLAGMLEHDPRVTAIQIIEDSDDQDFPDISFDLKSIQADYSAKKSNLDDIKKNKYAPLQIAFIRKLWEKELCGNQDIIKVIQSKYSIISYFPLTNANKFGVLISSGPTQFLIKFVSVGVPEATLDSIALDGPVSGVYSEAFRIIVVGENEASLYDIQAKDFILKTHKHQSKIVYAGFPTLDISSILTVTRTGIARLFDISNRTFYWMCMTDPSATHFFLKEDKLYYSVGSQLLSICLRTKEMVSVHHYAQPISQINPMYICSGKLYYASNKTGFQTKEGTDYISLSQNSKYHGSNTQTQYLLIKDTKIALNTPSPQLIGLFSIKNYEGENITDKVAIFGGSDGKTLQVNLEKSIA